MRRVKGQVKMSGQVVVELALFVVLFLGLIVGGGKLYNWYFSKPQTVTENSFNLLAKHIKYYDSISEDAFPLQVDDKHVIVGFDSSDAEKPSICKKSCLCICAKTCERIVRCQDLESNDGRDVKLAPIFFVAPEDAVREFTLKKDEPTGKLTIEKKFSE